ncbi:DUF6904 family protein [Arenibacter lacus]|uniref:DUF6904 family protein n=1 Tax=Arenibacter lacus TaxID=2608629 RepID=UPI00123D6ACB|nr:hypothetical protein [Arenibacter lacus]
MLYTIPTKKGMGVELWGTYEDLDRLYDLIGKFWNDENQLYGKGYENRGKLISSFSYEIRKAYSNQRLHRTKSHFSPEEQAYYGTPLSWVHFLFSLTAIKYNMRFYQTNKLDVATILQIEYWLDYAMNTYDEVGAKALIGFIEDGLYGGNDLIYQYMRSINLDYFLLGGGKRAFRKLPTLLKRGTYFSSENNKFIQIAITSRVAGPTKWLEKVTDKEYKN